MKRDPNLVRKILMYIGDKPAGWIGEQIRLEGVDQIALNDLLRLMEEDNLIEAHFTHHMGRITGNQVARMTARGHDYLDKIRNEEVWKDVLGKIEKAGGSLPIGMIESIAEDSLKKDLG